MNAIRQARQELGITQIALAERLGINQSTISRLESGSLTVDERTSLAIEALLARAACEQGTGKVHDGGPTAPVGAPSPGKTDDFAAPESEAA